MRSCLVVGAGVAGLLAARTLEEQGVRVTLLDKGRGVGGRMATRRIGSAVFDHGAQFFTARDPQFCALVNSWLAAEVATTWCHGFTGPEAVTRNDGHPRYRGATGMTSVPKFLAQGLEILLQQKVVSAETQGAQWKVRTDLGTTYTADALILTSPVPQSLAVLDSGGTTLPTAVRDALEAIRYDPCIALLVQPRKSFLPPPGGMQLPDEPIVWIGDNQHKGISPQTAITIHAGAEFSQSRWNSEDAEIAATLLSASSAWVSEPVSDPQVHRWRFAKPTTLHSAPCLALTELAPIAFAGDAFGAPRVEGAALSGIAAAQALLDALRG